MSHTNPYHRPDPRREAAHPKRGRKAREMERDEQRQKGGFVMALGHTGRKLRFKDADYFTAACDALTSRTYATVLEWVEYARSLPTGYYTAPRVGTIDEEGKRVWWKPTAVLPA